MSEQTLPPGAIVAQRLRVIRVLGAGGMGAVYEVEHMLTKHRRALKLLHRELTAIPSVVERFLREASAAGRIGNPHIVETFDAGMTEDGSPYLVMEMLEGESLASYLESQQRLEPAEAVGILVQVCDGIQAAHDRGIVHRDLKPENLFLSASPHHFVKILDFGISKFDPALTGATGATVEGSVLGTPYYMSPEQVCGAKDLDAAADLYALGVILYECLTGHRPFEAETLPHLAVLINQGQFIAASQRRPGLLGDFDAVIARALASDRKARYPSARAFAQTLQGLVSEESSRLVLPAADVHQQANVPLAKLPEPPLERRAIAGTPMNVETALSPGTPRKKSRVGVGLGVGFAVLAGAAGVFALWGREKTSPSEESPGVTSGEAPSPSIQPEPLARAVPSAETRTSGLSAPPAVVPAEASPDPAETSPVPAASSAASSAVFVPKPSAKPAAVASPRPTPPAAPRAETTAATPSPTRRSTEHGLSEQNPFK